MVAGLSLIVAPGALLLAALLVWLIGRGALRRLGGASGDVYGAAIELIETAVLLAMALPSGDLSGPGGRYNARPQPRSEPGREPEPWSAVSQVQAFHIDRSSHALCTSRSALVAFALLIAGAT